MLMIRQTAIIIAENVVLKDQREDSQDLTDFENCTDDDVTTMLEDLKRMGFLSDFDEEETDEEADDQVNKY